MVNILIEDRLYFINIANIREDILMNENILLSIIFQLAARCAVTAR